MEMSQSQFDLLFNMLEKKMSYAYVQMPLNLDGGQVWDMIESEFPQGNFAKTGLMCVSFSQLSSGADT
jgi:hypothetical protein